VNPTTIITGHWEKLNRLRNCISTQPIITGVGDLVILHLSELGRFTKPMVGGSNPDILRTGLTRRRRPKSSKIGHEPEIRSPNPRNPKEARNRKFETGFPPPGKSAGEFSRKPSNSALVAVSIQLKNNLTTDGHG